jgi:hypothetical protein
MFFEVFQASVKHLLHTKHLGPKNVPHIVNMSVRIRKQSAYCSGEVVKPLIVSPKRELLIKMPMSTATVGKAAVASAVTNWSETIT